MLEKGRPGLKKKIKLLTSKYVALKVVNLVGFSYTLNLMQISILCLTATLSGRIPRIF